MPNTKEMKHIQTATDPIQGWASKGELAALFDAAKACTGRGVIVEIGSWKGKSTIALGLGSAAGARAPVFAIDPHTGSPDHLAKRPGEKIWTFDEFKKNIRAAGLHDLVTPVLDTAERVAPDWKRPIELLHLDVNYHAYEPGKEDFLAWSKLVMDGGTIALHNTYPSLRVILQEGQPFHGWPGPRKVLRKFVFGKRGWKRLCIVDSTTFMEKNETASLYDRLRGRITQGQGIVLVFVRKLYGLLARRLPVPLKKAIKRVLLARAED